MNNYEINFDKSTLTIKAVVKGRLREGDIKNKIKPQLVQIFKENSQIKGALIDAIDFHGWDELSEMIEHFIFLKDYDERIHKIAILADEVWKKALQAIGVSLETKIRVFGSDEAEKAQNWLQEPQYAGYRMQ